MLKNKAQIARESIKTNLELPGPLSGPWTPAECEFSFALVMCVRAHNMLRPPKSAAPRKNAVSDIFLIFTFFQKMIAKIMIFHMK